MTIIHAERASLKTVNGVAQTVRPVIVMQETAGSFSFGLGLVPQNGDATALKVWTPPQGSASLLKMYRAVKILDQASLVEPDTMAACHDTAAHGFSLKKRGFGNLSAAFRNPLSVKKAPQSVPSDAEFKNMIQTITNAAKIEYRPVPRLDLMELAPYLAKGKLPIIPELGALAKVMPDGGTTFWATVNDGGSVRKLWHGVKKSLAKRRKAAPKTATAAGTRRPALQLNA